MKIYNNFLNKEGISAGSFYNPRYAEEIRDYMPPKEMACLNYKTTMRVNTTKGFVYIEASENPWLTETVQIFANLNLVNADPRAKHTNHIIDNRVMPTGSINLVITKYDIKRYDQTNIDELEDLIDNYPFENHLDDTQVQTLKDKMLRIVKDDKIPMYLETLNFNKVNDADVESLQKELLEKSSRYELQKLGNQNYLVNSKSLSLQKQNDGLISFNDEKGDTVRMENLDNDPKVFRIGNTIEAYWTWRPNKVGDQNC